MKTRNLYVLTIVFIGLGCTKNKIYMPPDNGMEFSVKSSVINVKASTRTAYEGALSPTNPLTALVLTSKASLNYATANVVCNGTMTFISATNVVYNKPVTSGSYLFPTGGSLFYLSALYPATGWELTATDGKARRTLTGKEDVMFALQGMTNAIAVGEGNYPTMAFTHKLAFLRLWFSGDEDAIRSTTVTNIQLTSIKGAAIPTDMEVNLSTDPQTVTFAGAATTLRCYATGKDTDYATTYAQGYPVTGTPAEIAYILVPPTLITPLGESYEYTFTVDYVKSDVNKSLSIQVDLASATDESAESVIVGHSTEGYMFDITFNFVSGQLHATATVAAWKDGSELNIDI